MVFWQLRWILLSLLVLWLAYTMPAMLLLASGLDWYGLVPRTLSSLTHLVCKMFAARGWCVSASAWMHTQCYRECLQSPPYVFIELEQKDFKDTIKAHNSCLRANCRAELAACARQQKCLTALVTSVYSCSDKSSEVCIEGGLANCSARFVGFWRCAKKSCDMASVVKGLPYIFKAHFSLEEVAQFYKLKDHVLENGTSKSRDFGDKKYGNSGGHIVTHVNTLIRQHFPGVLDRVLKLAEEADRIRGWGAMQALRVAKKALRPRTMEFISYSQERNASIGSHMDQESIMTVVVMLSSRSAYGGGLLEVEAVPDCCVCQPHVLELDIGDVLVLRSWQGHLVTPVTKGQRNVYVSELWEFEENLASEQQGMEPPRAALQARLEFHKVEGKENNKWRFTELIRGLKHA